MSSLPNPNEFTDYKATLSPNTYTKAPLESVSLERVANEFYNFEPLSERHSEYLFLLLPKWVLDDANITDMEYFTSLVRFDVEHSSLVALVVDNQPLKVEIISYKHRLKHGIKWRSRKGTHPNNTVMYRIWNDKEPVVVVEGIRDFLAGVLLGLNIVGVPTASYKGSLSNITQSDTVYFLIEDDKAEPLMMRLSKEVATVAKEVFVIPPNNEKMDLTDICYQCSSKEEVLNAITNA